jgi:hypothetical protein
MRLVVPLLAAFLPVCLAAQDVPYRLGRWDPDSLGNHRAVVRVTATAVTVQVQRTVGGTATVLGSTATLAGGDLAANNSVQVKFQATGNGTTTLRAKIWRTGDDEPTAWSVTTTDSTAALQTSGATGLYSYLSSSSINGPVTAKFDQFVVTPI